MICPRGCWECRRDDDDEDDNNIESKMNLWFLWWVRSLVFWDAKHFSMVRDQTTWIVEIRSNSGFCFWWSASNKLFNLWNSFEWALLYKLTWYEIYHRKLTGNLLMFGFFSWVHTSNITVYQSYTHTHTHSVKMQIECLWAFVCVLWHVLRRPFHCKWRGITAVTVRGQTDSRIQTHRDTSIDDTLLNKL